jgi:hypothetical protein
MRRLMLLLLALPLLAACNQVYTRLPLISEAHEGGDPEFRPGLYSVAGYNEDCKFDIRKRSRDWPDCGVGVEFRRGQMFFVTSHDRALAQTLRFVDGDPILVQGKWRTDVLRDPRTPEPKDTDNPFYGWVYYAVTPTRMDGEGHIREATMVQAQCGPLPVAQPGRPAARVTDRPFAGLTVVHDNCQARDLDTVKRTLQLSAGLGESRVVKWVRDDP